MKNRNTRLLDGKNDENKSHAEFISASSTQAVLPWKQQRQALKILNQVQNDFMIITTNGFTLIELLVVVLIIGILAAVALPQYQKAVKKAHFVQIQALTKSFADSAYRYYLENEEPPDYWTDLDVEFPEGCRQLGGSRGYLLCARLNISCDLMGDYKENIICYNSAVVGPSSRTTFGYVHYFGTDPKPRECLAAELDAAANQFCVSLGGIKKRTAFSYSMDGKMVIYELS